MRSSFAGAACVALIAAGQMQGVDFQKDVAPILGEYCFACHSPDKAAGGLALTSRLAVMEKRAIVPGKPEASPLYTLSALAANERRAMPPGGPRMPDAQLAMLKRWIAEGAPWPKDAEIRGGSQTAPADEKEMVRRIHARILERQKTSQTGRYSVTIPNSTVRYDMVPIPAGSFLMGSPESDTQGKPDERPQHEVHVDAFWMQAHEVTWDEYRLFMFSTQGGKVPVGDGLADAVAGPTRPYVEMSFGMGIDGFPAISMTQHAANKYAEWLSAKTGEYYRLPTETEWEYACRAGASAAGASKVADVAWYSVNSGGKYQKVATKQPNAWGLYDILGNVMEWTLDQYAPYAAGLQTNPWVQSTAPYPHTARGGSWNDDAGALRCAARTPSDPSWKQQDPQLPKSIWYLTDAQWLGFRLVRPARIPPADVLFQAWNNGVEHDEQ